VETTQEMLEAVMENISSASILLMAAAPLDFEPKTSYTTKIDKHSIKSIPLKLCPDILKKVSNAEGKTIYCGLCC